MKRKIKIGIIDDHEVVLEGLTNLLMKSGEFEVVFATSDGKSGEELSFSNPIEVLILDVRIPNFNTAEFLKHLTSQRDVKVVCLSSFDSPYEISKLLKSGASAYIVKTASGEKILETIKKVLSGELIIDSEISKTLENFHLVSHVLTEKEIEIVKLIADGLSNKEIANQLNITTSTVKTHIKKIMDKLKAKNRAEIVSKFFKEGLRDEIS